MSASKSELSSSSAVSSVFSFSSSYIRIASLLGTVCLAGGVYYLISRNAKVGQRSENLIPGWDGLNDRQQKIILRFFRSYRKWYLAYKRSVSTAAANSVPLVKSPFLDADHDSELIAQLKKSHVTAMKVFPYKCVSQMRFALPRISSHPVFFNLFGSDISGVDPTIIVSPAARKAFSSITLPESSPSFSSSSIFVDLGCCFATDSRALLCTGKFSPSQIFCLDITRGFFDLGNSLFEDSDILADQFRLCNILEDNCWHSSELQQIYKKVNLLYAGSVYHLFTLEQTIDMTANVLSVLSEDGIFFGRTVGSGAGKPFELGGKDSKRQLKYLHTKQTLKQLLEEAGFKKVAVEEEDINQAYLENMLVTKGVTMLAFAAQK